MYLKFLKISHAELIDVLINHFFESLIALRTINQNLKIFEE